ncbi:MULTISPECIES: ABC transporter substrate-binding protein [Bradyrhizobium]|jgi:multiple sugar transport system substrate-binding protein|uniref:Substrate-binding protein n=1 Tax=Bradyrhizobium ottawaense TaxID=931866 RepID=A0A2U8P5F1_9BRAD|nr:MULTISPECIES: extracellular solute-binding protein [Bradyrhizobium]AWL92960.1 substrate-binding protein [Bradyrhizobium ottawaense]MBR1292941.1 extracellular solute-binding protein [Bradyrhizobium ottawaense]MBR1330674.1 extracellular solute-binding protein [Bradyrhizobium ottawaense]MBR1337217.1 extracellular solute-binding protein [Bradyrhizobium ottawaense]MDA9445940.1 substrate-binding protein [Bradyrhizobium sp. CCBAU 21360]
MDGNSSSGRAPVSRRSFVKGLGAAGAVLPAFTMLPRTSLAVDDQAYASAAIDWKQFAGQAITLAGAIHPWSSAITPLLPDFTKLTGINVVTDFAPETTYLSAIPIRLARGSSTPDVCMFATYGQGISGGWLEPLNAYYSKKSLTDLVWYDERDLLKTARTFSLWPDGERYGFTITSEAMTLFLNSEMLAAKDLPAPQTFDELLATARAVKTDAISGIAMRAQAGGNSTPAAMAFVFSYGGAMIKDNRAAFASPEAIAAVDMYGRLLREAGPIGVGSYEWYQVLDDFLQGRTAMAIDSSNFATDISNPAKSHVAKQAGFAAFPHLPGREPVPFMSHWQACINSKSKNKQAAFLFLLWATSKPTSLRTAAAGLATTRLSAWSSEAFNNAFGRQAAEAALSNLQKADVDRAKAILFHPQSRPIQDVFMIGVNEVVSGVRSAKDAMIAAAEKANAAIRG